MEHRVLIVGVGPAATEMAAMVTSFGYPVAEASPADVAAAIPRLKPQLLLLAFTGAVEVSALTQAIQMTPFGAVVPVVFFGPPPGPNPVEVVQLGGDRFLPTPVAPPELKSYLERLLGPAPAAAAPAPFAPALDARVATGASRLTPRPGAPVRPGAVGVDVVDALDALDDVAAPWEGLPGLSSLPGVPGPAPRDILGEAVAADALLDPRVMAQEIADEGGERLPEPVGSTRRLDDAPVAEGQTIAVQIRKLFRDHVEPDLDAPGPAPSDTPGPGRPAAGGDLASRLARPLDEIDLDALDQDTFAGADEARPPSALADLLATPRSTPAPEPPSGRPSGLVTVAPTPPPPWLAAGAPVLAPSADRDTRPARPAGPIGPVAAPVAQPATPAPSAPVAPPAPPAPSAPVTSMEGAPLVSPYDLPPVILGLDPSQIPWERIDRDTVPGRRTAVIVRQYLEGAADLERPRGTSGPAAPGAPTDTQPAKRRTATDLERPHLPGATVGAAAAAGYPARTQAPAPSPGPPTVAPARAAGPGPGRPTTGAGAPTSSQVILAGRLETRDPARVLMDVFESRRSGVLRISVASDRLEIAFHEGLPRYAQSSRPTDRMLALLLREGWVREDQAARCEQEMLLTSRRAGAVLLDLGLLRPAELIPLVRRHLEEICHAVLALDAGEYQLLADASLPDEIVYLDRPLGALLLDGVRRSYGPARIQRRLGVERIFPVFRSDAGEAALGGAVLPLRTWRLLMAMDGRSDAAALARATGEPVEEVWAVAYALSLLGMVSLPSARQPDAAPPDHPAAPVPVDVRSGPDPALVADRLLGRHRLVADGDYCRLLGVTVDAAEAEVRAAHARAREQVDPRAFPPDVAARYAAEIAEVREVLDEALGVLLDPVIGPAYRDHLTRSAAAGDRRGDT